MLNQNILLIPSFVTKTSWFCVSNKSWRGGKCEYWHSKSIFFLELLTYIVWKLESFTGCAFSTKRYLSPLSIKWHLENHFSPFGGWVTTVPLQCYIQRFLSTHKYGAVHKLCQPKMGGSRPPLPPLSSIVSIYLTPPPPFVSQCQHFPNPPLPPLSAMSAFAQPPFLFRVSFVNIFKTASSWIPYFFVEEITKFDKSY